MPHCTTRHGIHAKLLATSPNKVSVIYWNTETGESWTAQFPAVKIESYRQPNGTFSKQGFRDLATDGLDGLI
jgi:hypothetical protein